MSDLTPGPGGVRGLIGSPTSTRVRRLGPAANGALHSGYDVWWPIDYLFTPFKDRYLNGEVKGVMASVPLKHGNAFESFNVVPVAPSLWAETAARHRSLVLAELTAQYKAAIVRAIHGSSKKRKRVRAKINKEHAPLSIARIDEIFAEYPDAIRQAAQIRALWEEIFMR